MLASGWGNSLASWVRNSSAGSVVRAKSGGLGESVLPLCEQNFAATWDYAGHVIWVAREGRISISKLVVARGGASGQT